MTVSIRALVAKDSVNAVHVFFDAIHNSTKEVYNEEQRLAWAGSEPNVEGWRNRFDDVQGYAAEHQGELIGFMTIDNNGYIDLAFVRSEVIGIGIGAKLYRAVEAHAAEHQIKKLTTNASKKAKPFFERMGWQVDKQQTVKTSGVDLVNYKMFKMLE